MSDDTNPAPAGDTNTDATGQPDVGASSPSAPEPPDANALAARLRKREKELQQAQQRLTQFEQVQAEKAKAEMSEVERLKAERDQYKQQAEETTSRFLETQKRNAFKFAAQQAGALDAGAALKLADLSTLDFDGDEVTGIDTALKALKKSSPYLFGSPATAAGSGGGNPSSGAPTVAPADILKMSRAELKEFEGKLARGEIKL